MTKMSWEHMAVMGALNTVVRSGKTSMVKRLLLSKLKNL